ncbi:MAG: SRPBCC family protein [Micromonosporaceae bacterium]
MSDASAIPDINGKITVAAPIERAFQVFTESIVTWWPAAYHIGEAEMAEPVMEPRVGGRWYERGVDGSECDWGRVLVWEPPHRLVVTWQINGEWRYDPDPDHASEVDVRFTADGPEQTTVELQHRFLERLLGGEAMHAAIGGAGGWSGVLTGYAKAVESGS